MAHSAAPRDCNQAQSLVGPSRIRCKIVGVVHARPRVCIGRSDASPSVAGYARRETYAGAPTFDLGISLSELLASTRHCVSQRLHRGGTMQTASSQPARRRVRLLVVPAAVFIAVGTFLIQGAVPAFAVGVPDAPTNVMATAGFESATISWTAPFDNGSQILNYSVTAAPGGSSITVDGTQTSALFSGLADGTAYTFTVTATNAVGTGGSSLPSNSVTPDDSLIACGDNVDHSLVLTKDLVCTGTALSIGGGPTFPNVLDLGGHTVATANTPGVYTLEALGHPTIKNGTIVGGGVRAWQGGEFDNLTLDGFGIATGDAGVLVQSSRFIHGAGVGSHGGTFLNNTFTGPGSTAIFESCWEATIVGNTISGYNTGVIWSGGCGSGPTVIQQNLFELNGTAVSVAGFGNSATITGNQFVSNAVDGVAVGYEYPSVSTTVNNNLFVANGGNGIDLSTAPCCGPDLTATLTSNMMANNTGLGVASPPNGPFVGADSNTYTVNVTDGGGNQATGNGGLPQCQNVACTPLADPFVVVVSPSTPATAVGQPVTLSATAFSVPGSPTLPAGTIRFYDGTTLLGSKATTTGSASITTAKLAVGTHSITATFTKKRTTTALSSLAFPELVNPAVTQVGLTSNRNPSVHGRSATFKVTVVRQAPAVGKVAGGTVTFYADGTVLGTVNATRGKATFVTTSLTAGTHQITASYSGSTTDQPSGTTAAITQTVT